MSNGFKIIMGVVELNRILGINLGVPDIEDVYDLCKSRDEDIYYLRAREKRSGFVTALEDSNRYVGDDCVFVSGEWEFDDSEPVASRVVRIPRRLETPPSKDRDLLAFLFFSAFISAGLISFACCAGFRQRRQTAKRTGWVRNNAWLL